MIIATITGNLGADAELRTTQSGTSVCKFRVASSRKRGGEETTTWVSCAVYGKRAEGLAPHLRKGGKVAVAGTLWTNDSDDGKTWVNLDVPELDFMSRRDDGQRASAPMGNDDLPF